jgi:hypothetical protein
MASASRSRSHSMDTLMQTSLNSVPSSSIQCPVTRPSSVIPWNGRHSESMSRPRTAGLTALPSLRLVGMRVVNFTASGPPGNRRGVIGSLMLAFMLACHKRFPPALPRRLPLVMFSDGGRATPARRELRALRASRGEGHAVRLRLRDAEARRRQARAAGPVALRPGGADGAALPAWIGMHTCGSSRSHLSWSRSARLGSGWPCGSVSVKLDSQRGKPYSTAKPSRLTASGRSCPSRPAIPDNQGEARARASTSIAHRLPRCPCHAAIASSS